MNRVCLLVDGFNLYHSLDSNPTFQPYKWLDLSKLASTLCGKKDEIKEIYYFTALTPWLTDKCKRHKLYIKALESTGVNIVYGKFKKRDVKCRICRKTYKQINEKQTDVNVAVHLLQLAIEDRYDTAILLTGDSDLIPAITSVHAVYPNKTIRVALPFGRASESLKEVADENIKIKMKHITTSRFLDEIDTGVDKINCPSRWLLPSPQDSV